MIDSMTVSMIEIALQNPVFDFEIFGNLNFFLIFIMTMFVVIGLFARSVTLGSMAGFLVFVHIAVESQLTIFVTLLMALLVGVFMIMAFQFWDFGSNGEVAGGGE